MSRKLSVVVPLLLVLALIAACAAPVPGGGSAAVPASDAGESSGEAMTLETLTISYAAEPVNLDPVQTGGITEGVFSAQVFDGLVFRTAEGEIVPRLAESWEQVDDNTWRFHLREGVSFHNGEPFNAEAVTVALERYKSDVSLQASRFTNIVEANAVDDFTVDFITETPDPILPNLFINNMYPMPPQYIAENTDEFLAANPVGTGPYIFQQWDRGEQIVLEANPDYWQGPVPIPNVIFKPIGEVATRVAALLTGETDLIWEVSPSMTEQVNGSGTATIKSVPGPRAVYIGLWPTGTQDAPQFADPRVRQAMNYAVNRQAIVDRLLFGHGTLLGQPVPSLYLGHNADIEPYPYDPERAEELLAEAGYPDGFEVNMDFASRWLTAEQAQVVQANLADVGIVVNLNELEPSTFLNELTGGNVAPMFSLSIQGRVGIDADEIFQVAMICDGSFNWVKYCNEEVDTLIAEGRQSADPAVRAEAFQKANELIHEDAPWIFMWNNNSIWGVSDRLDWSPRQDDQLFVYDDVRAAQ